MTVAVGDGDGVVCVGDGVTAGPAFAWSKAFCAFTRPPDETLPSRELS
ncbi:hypothetical protein ASZ90_016114 [hydrocarbon metagenome]|uniref:Uncharacterized protein n=1 Tax=hydrocarbon metagenome TaxID=938273 RepID=A0A0W8F0J5_9ZZZZ